VGELPAAEKSNHATGKWSRLFVSNNPRSQDRQSLFINGRSTGVTVECDRRYPTMWRVRRGDELSDITNISRATDAALSWARPRGLGGYEVAQWHRREMPAGASPVRKNGPAHVRVAGARAAADGGAP
jgi:hypothetical protein